MGDKEAVEKEVYARGEMSWQHGMELFNQYCASCHNFSEGGIGPNLAGVTSQVSKEWLITFIRNPQAVIEGGDPRAAELFKKYKQYMPPFSMIKENDLEDILGFVHKFSMGEKRKKNDRKGGLINPVPDKIPFSNLTLELQQQFTVPASSEITPVTRINKMSPGPNNRLFIHDLRGKLFEVKNDSSLTVYMDLVDELPNFKDNPGKGTGFGSWAFHPDFAQNGLLYTTHNEPARTKVPDFGVPDSIRVTIQAVLLEWKTNNPGSSEFSGSYRELLRVDMVGGVHGFQELTFNPLATPGNPDYGLLYLGVGDAGSMSKGLGVLCDNLQHIWGKVLRIKPEGRNSANGRYGIPEDNPFVKEENALGEIWASGFRNPHRISWDETGSGKMFITNIGQHSLEEVNIGIAGANYGWPFREGTFLFDADANRELVYPLPEDDADYTYPVAQYDHDEGSAISGGFVYAGKIRELKGKYIFGDITHGTLFYSEVEKMVNGAQAPVYRMHIAIEGVRSDMQTLSGNQRVDFRLGTDSEGELYLLAKANGAVYKVTDCLETKQPQ